MLRKFIFLALLFILTSACAAPEYEEPLPIELWQVQYSPALTWLGPSMNRCANELGSIGIISLEGYDLDFDSNSSRLVFRWGPPVPENSHAVILGGDELVFITHPDNPVLTLSQNQIIQFYSQPSVNPGGQTGPRIFNPWSYPPGSDLEMNFTTFISNQKTRNPSLNIAPDPEAMLEQISRDVNSIGYVPARWLEDRVRMVAITGLNQEDSTYPILLITSDNLTPLQTLWVKCIQDLINSN